MSRLSSAAFGAVVAAVLSFAPSLAETDSITVMASAPTTSGLFVTSAVKVSLAGLDLSSGAGATEALDRLDVAARKVCGERAGVAMNGQRTKQFNTCRARVVRYATEQLDVPNLTQVAAAR